LGGKTSRKMMIFKRLAELKETIRVDTQRIRGKTLNSLQELFDLAVALAKGKVKTQNEEGVAVKVTLKQRQMWARVAAYIAQIMNSVASGFDERQIDVQLDELERLVNEAKAKGKAGETEKRDASATGGNPS
jgi:hypothetical protein